MNIVTVLQGIGIVLAALGLSAGPWIVALLAGRLVPVSTVKRERADLISAKETAEATAVTWQGVAERQTTRGDDAIKALSALATETTNAHAHLIKALGQQPEGGGDGG